MIVDAQNKDKCIPVLGIRAMAMRLVKQRVSRKGESAVVKGWRKKNCVSNSWIKGLIKRNPDITRRRSGPLYRSRREANVGKV
jgi:hypothetical protein